jgi:hypothetical protein
VRTVSSMPRLQFWGLSAAATAGVSYAGYHYVYEPRHVAQVGEEHHLTVSRRQYQDVVHAHARLRAKVEEQLRSNSSSSSGAVASAGAWFTNAEKIVFFCDIQLVRRLLWSLPHHLTTEQDLRRMFGELSLLEKQHCTELHFRDTPLLFTQTLRSMACYALYVLTFRVAAPLLALWDGLAGRQAWLQHHAARFITNALGIEVVMVVAAEKSRLRDESPLVHAGDAGDENSSAASVSTLDGDTPVRYIMLSTTHWIEEVGFWACANNPLLAQHPREEGQASANQSRDGATVRLLRVSPCGNLTPATTYAQHWRHKAAEELAREKATPDVASLAGAPIPPPPPALPSSPVSSSTSSLVDVAATEVSLGYPVLTVEDALQSHHERKAPSSSAASYIAVGVSGLPRVLYVDAAHAAADVRPRLTREEVYARRQRAQFTRVTSPFSPSADATAELKLTSAAALTKLQRWRIGGGLPWWRRVWWGGVYGESCRASAAAPSCTLRYYLGTPCTAGNYVTEAIEASRAVEMLPYSSS